MCNTRCRDSSTEADASVSGSACNVGRTPKAPLTPTANTDSRTYQLDMEGRRRSTSSILPRQPISPGAAVARRAPRLTRSWRAQGADE